MSSPAAASPELGALLARLPPTLVGLCRTLAERGRRAWIVGGSIRDLLRGRPVKDWDVATDARPAEVMHAFRRVVPTGLQHGTVTVLLGGESYEVTTLRGEGAYADGRRPAEVVFLDDIVEDLARRDFTVNAIALDPMRGTIIDPFDGQGDMARSVLRAVGSPKDRFGEDGLRVLRAARFAATLECEIEPLTRAAMSDPGALETLRKVSPERVREEWMKAMAAAAPSRAFRVMQEAGVLAVHCPELGEGVGCAQNRWHSFDVWEHTLQCLDACPPEDPVLRVAALLHDVGKPATRELSDKTGDYTFYNHELVGAQLADTILRRLRFSNEHRARIVAVVRHHLICYSSEWTDAAVRRWIRRVGPERIADLCQLAVADAHAKGGDASATLRGLAELGARVAELERQGAALARSDLAVDGNDLMRELGLRPSRLVGELLDGLLELVTEQPERNERDVLLAAARELLAERTPPARP